MPDFMENLTKALVERGLVKGNIKVDHSDYIFADGRWEIQTEAPEKQNREDFDSTREFQERIVEKTKKPEFELKKQADKFIDDYFPNKKDHKTRKGPWIVAIVIVVAISVFFIVKKTGQVEKSTPQLGESQNQEQRQLVVYQALLREATSLFADNLLNSAWQKAEEAEKIKPTTEIANLKKEIKKKQEEVATAAKVRADEEKRIKGQYAAKEIDLKKYLDACKKSLQQGDFDQAFENFTKAKQIGNSPEVVTMGIRLKTIQTGIEEQKRKIQKNYLDACKKFLQQGDFDQAFENFTKAKQIGNSPEVVTMGIRLKTIQTGIEEQKRKIQKNYLDACEKFLQQGNFDLAGKNLIKAKQISNSPEVVALENQLKILLYKASPKQETVVANADVSKPVVQPQILPGKISDLASDLIESYLALVKRISISDVTGNFSVSGFVSTTMKIDENGRVWVQSVNDSGLSTEPESYREKIRKAITFSLSKLSFPEPKNRVGKRITVENWRVNFKVGQFSGQILINRQ